MRILAVLCRDARNGERYILDKFPDVQYNRSARTGIAVVYGVRRPIKVFVNAESIKGNSIIGFVVVDAAPDELVDAALTCVRE